MGHQGLGCRGARREAAVSPETIYGRIVFRLFFFVGTEFDAFCFGLLNSLPLAAQGVFPLGFGNIAEDLENKVRDHDAGEIFLFPGIEKGHIQDDDMGTDDLGDDSPLFLDLAVVPAEAVNAFDHEDIARLQPFHQAAVNRAVKIPAGDFLAEDIGIRNAEVFHGRKLAIEVLVTGADAAVGIHAGSLFHG